VTSVNRATGVAVAGPDVAAEIGAVAAPAAVPAASAAVAFSGAFAPLQAARANVNPTTLAHFITSTLHVIRMTSRHDWRSDNKTGIKTALIVTLRLSIAKSLPLGTVSVGSRDSGSGIRWF
jgi:cell division septal protein FtsQ